MPKMSPIDYYVFTQAEIASASSEEEAIGLALDELDPDGVGVFGGDLVYVGVDHAACFAEQVWREMRHIERMLLLTGLLEATGNDYEEESYE